MQPSESSSFILDGSLRISPFPGAGRPVEYALRILERDVAKVFGARSSASGGEILLRPAAPGDPVYGKEERFCLAFDRPERGPSKRLEIVANDDLGFVYGLLHVSGAFLGVDPFWFWMDREPERRSSVGVSPADYLMPEPRVRYRGWFVNDEDALIGWTDVYPPPEEVWFPVFESLLRLGGNMVIAGTDLPRDGPHNRLASEMGLWITQHHAEPLGAEMFRRAYPDAVADYGKSPELFERLWGEAVESAHGRKTVWALGFRGQGDCPFWETNPDYDTPARRGALISKAIRRQFEIVSERVEKPVFCAYIYGELTELYLGGWITFPEGTIKIWADNGYGALVTRRQWNANPRHPALPPADDPGPHGLYYHVAFHDLQASNHLTMLQSPPAFVRGELRRAFDAGADTYLLVNSSYIRPHVLFLDLAARLWLSSDADADSTVDGFCDRFFPSIAADVRAVCRAYWKAAIRYGPNPDDMAGEEFYHHVPRSIVTWWLKGSLDETDADLIWAAGSIGFRDQVRWFLGTVRPALASWRTLKAQGEALAADTPDGLRFRDTVLLQIRLHYTGCLGSVRLCESFLAFESGSLPEAFTLAARSLDAYREGLGAMEEAAVGRWKNFFRDDLLTNVRATAYCIETLMGYLRVRGDGPNLFGWSRSYLVPETERGVLLENTTRRVLSDADLARGLERVFPVPDDGAE
jgi:hypothetical protein